METLAIRKPRWKAIDLRLEELLCWVRGALGAWARGQNRLGRLQGRGGSPLGTVGKNPRLHRGAGDRRRDSTLAGDANCTVICLRGTCLIPGFAFCNQLAECTQQH